MKFLLQILVSWNFLFGLTYLFLIFSFLSDFFSMLSVSNIPRYFEFFSPSEQILFWFGSSFSHLFTFFYFSLWVRHILIFQISYLNPWCIFLLFTSVSLISIIIFSPLEFFTSVLADCFSLEFEWQQISSSLQDLSQDSGRY